MLDFQITESIRKAYQQISENAALAIPAAGEAIFWTASMVAGLILTMSNNKSRISLPKAESFADMLNSMKLSYEEGKKWLESKIPQFTGVPYTPNEESQMKANSYANSVNRVDVNASHVNRVKDIFNNPTFADTSEKPDDGDDEDDNDKNKKEGKVKKFVKKIIPTTPKDAAITAGRLAGAEATKRSGDFVADKMEDLSELAGNDNLYKAAQAIRFASNGTAALISPRNALGSGLSSVLPNAVFPFALAGKAGYDAYKSMHKKGKGTDDNGNNGNNGWFHWDPLFGQQDKYLEDGIESAVDYVTPQPEDTSAIDEYNRLYGGK